LKHASHFPILSFLTFSVLATTTQACGRLEEGSTSGDDGGTSRPDSEFGDADHDAPDAATCSPGMIDPTFGEGGLMRLVPTARPGTWDSFHDALLDPVTGRLVVAGVAWDPSNESYAGFVTRFFADGTRDPAVASDPEELRRISTLEQLQIGPDGRMLGVIAYTRTIHTNGENKLARFRPDGRLDRVFANDGVLDVQENPPACAPGWIFDAAGLSDGKVVAVGLCPAATDDGSTAVIMRFETNGTLDPSFGVSGAVAVSGASSAFRVVPAANGRMIVAGRPSDSCPTCTALFAFDANGRPDPTFGAGGRVGPSDLPPSITFVKILDDGKIYIAGGEDAIVRLLPDGAFDETFGVHGKASLPALVSKESPWTDIVLDRGGKLVTATVDRMHPVEPCEVIRLNTDGTRDKGFGTGGWVRDVPMAKCRLIEHPELGTVIVGEKETTDGAHSVLAVRVCP
jgi:uncharacterized delta-60 repeat protein